MEQDNNIRIKYTITNENCKDLTNNDPNDFAKLTGIEAYTTDYTVDISGNNLAPVVVVNANDKKLHLKRMFQIADRVIENDRFDVDSSIQSRGHGLAVFAEQVKEAQKAGYKVIKVIASKNLPLVVGHYVWARMGFSPDGKEEKQDIEDHLKRTGFKGEETEPQKIVTNPEHRQWWKEIGVSYVGKFDLSEDSENIKILEAYKQEKGYYEDEEEN